jgi:spore maturation protein CgeB
VRQHLYEARFTSIIDRALGLAGERRNKPWEINADMLQPAVERHRRGTALRKVFDGLKDASSGRARRLWRALRRLAYEFSWRVCGERTFRAGGLPGRFFYRES